jgi:hypothetical protein
MSTFRRCRRKWYVTTYRRLQPRVGPAPGSPLSIGSLVHDALAAYYDPEQRADPVAYALDRVDVTVRDNPGLEDEIRKENDLATIMLEGYLEWLEETGADADLVLEGSERVAEASLSDDVTLISKLDAPVSRRSDGAKLALEHKTVGALRVPAELKLDTQLLTEHLVRFMDAQAKGATPEEAYDQCRGVLYNMLRKVKRTAAAKPPFYGREEVPHNIHELRNHWRHVMAIAREIQHTTERLDAGESHHTACPPTPIADRCKWDCPLFKICVLADDGSDFEGALGALFEEGDPLERYVGAEAL